MPGSGVTQVQAGAATSIALVFPKSRVLVFSDSLLNEICSAGLPGRVWKGTEKENTSMSWLLQVSLVPLGLEFLKKNALFDLDFIITISQGAAVSVGWRSQQDKR